VSTAACRFSKLNVLRSGWFSLGAPNIEDQPSELGGNRSWRTVRNSVRRNDRMGVGGLLRSAHGWLAWRCNAASRSLEHRGQCERNKRWCSNRFSPGLLPGAIPEKVMPTWITTDIRELHPTEYVPAALKLLFALPLVRFPMVGEVRGVTTTASRNSLGPISCLI